MTGMTGVTGDERLRQAALEIFRAGLDAVDPYLAVKRCLAREGDQLVVHPPPAHDARLAVRHDLRAVRRVVVVGGGKATARMSQAVEELLGDRIDDGLIVVKHGHTAPVPSRRVRVIEAAHPVPDGDGERGAREIVELVSDLGADDLVISLISGGGSALLPLPAVGVSLEHKQRLTAMLLGAGADIGQINAVRKHISAIKGGQLARAACPAAVVNLMLSDVVGDHLDVIASGPAVADSSSFADARAILVRHGLWDSAPASVRRRIEAGVAGEIPDTPEAGDPIFDRCTNLIIGSNLIALQACASAARARGFEPLLLSSSIEGETRDIARMHAAIAREIRGSALPLPPPACVVSGGETTVTMRGAGQGGRNQEFALAAALEISGLAGVAIFSGGTDGTDGPTDAAGAIAFGDTLDRAAAAGLSARRHLDDHDAYPLFEHSS